MTDLTSQEISAQERLIRLEVKLDLALSNGTDHEARLRRLERALWLATGAAAAAGGVVGSFLSKLISG